MHYIVNSILDLWKILSFSGFKEFFIDYKLEIVIIIQNKVDFNQ